MKYINLFIDKIAHSRKYQLILFLIILFILSIIMIFSYYPIHPGQDFFFHYMRFQALMDGLKSNIFLVYLDCSAIDGYGYFTKAFYSDFILIPFAVLGNLTNAKIAYLVMIFVMTFLCGYFTYYSVNKILNNTFIASITAILYTFSIYRLLDLYHRAALGEAFSFTFVPIVFLGLYYIIKGDYRKWYVFTIGFSLMIFTHLISTILMLLTVIIIVIISYKLLLKEPKRILYLFLSGLVALIITSYYLFPMIEQMLSDTFYYKTNNVMAKAEDAGYSIHYIIWGLFTGIVHPKQIFIAGTGFLLTATICLRLFVFDKSAQLKSIDTGVIIGIAYVFASSSLFPWHIFPFKLLNFIQLPWRLYEFVTYFFALAGGYYLYQILKRSNKRLFIAAGLIIITTLFVIVSDGRFFKDVRSSRSIDEPAMIDNQYHMGGLEYVPSRVPSIQYLADRGNRVESLNKDTHIDNFARNHNVTQFDITVNSKDIVELPLIYYKGYKALLNNNEVPAEQNNHGLVALNINESGHVTVYYEGTLAQRLGWLISVISIIIFVVYIIIQNKRAKIISDEGKY